MQEERSNRMEKTVSSEHVLDLNFMCLLFRSS